MYAKRRQMHKKKRTKDKAKQLSKEHKKKHIGKKEVNISAYSRKYFETKAHNTQFTFQVGHFGRLLIRFRMVNDFVGPGNQ